MIVQAKEINYKELKKEYWNKAKQIERELLAKKIVKASVINKKKALSYS